MTLVPGPVARSGHYSPVPLAGTTVIGTTSPVHTLHCWIAAISEWCQWAKHVAGAPPTTIRTRSEHLRLLAKSIDAGPWDVTGEQLRAWFTVRAAGWMPNTARSRRTTYRAFYAWAVEAGHVEASPALAIPRQPLPIARPRPVPDAAYQAAIAAAGPRERLMCRLAAEHGLRRAEVAQVWPARDVVADLYGWSLVVRGKGGKERMVPLLDDVARELLASGPGYAFPGQDNGHLSPRWVGTIIGRLIPGDYTMHKLRHRAGTLWYERSGDLAAVQDLLGHASPATTRTYVQVNARRLRAVVEGATS